MTPPVLQTERLTLRGPEARDLDPFLAYWASDRSRFTGGPIPRKDAWRLFATEIGHWPLRGFGMWTVTWRGEDRSLGMVGGWFPEAWPEPEIGWMLWPEAEGRGVAHEAALAARGFVYGTLGWLTAVSYIDEPNVRSRRLAEKLGATVDPDAPHLKDDPTILTYRHPSPESLS